MYIHFFIIGEKRFIFSILCNAFRIFIFIFCRQNVYIHCKFLFFSDGFFIGFISFGNRYRTIILYKKVNNSKEKGSAFFIGALPELYTIGNISKILSIVNHMW